MPKNCSNSEKEKRRYRVKFNTVDYSESRLVALDHWVKMGTSVSLEAEDTFEMAVAACRHKVNDSFATIFPDSLDKHSAESKLFFNGKAIQATNETLELLKKTNGGAVQQGAATVLT